MDKNMNMSPKHIGIIMDGNGRWAKNQGKIRSLGHKAGMDTVINIVEHANEIGLDYLTLYAFSTENWKRPKDEVSFLMNLLIQYIKNQLERLNASRVKINVLGDYSYIPDKARIEVEKAIQTTALNNGMVLNIALNYGGRDEIINACKSIASLVKDGELEIENIDSEMFQTYLYTASQPDPDLIIRTGSEMRLSNFLTYQSVYSELYFSDILWPDFSEENLDEAIQDFLNRKRRFGGL